MNQLQPPLTPAGVRISGTGIATPEKVMTNFDIEKLVDTSDDWIVKRTGIKQRYVVNANEQTTVDLAAEAVSMALKNADVEASDLDLLICATMTPEMTCPATACRVVDRIGATPCGSFDLSAACTGFIAALNMAHNAIKSGMYKKVAVVGAETMSRAIDWKDRRTCILFGDAASAAILEATDDASQGCFFQRLHSDGGQWYHLYLPRCEDDIPDQKIGAEFNGNMDTLQMNGREVFKFAVMAFENIIEETLEASGLAAEDIKFVLPHQSNARILKNARDRLGFSDEQFYINIDRYGNTSAASVGICLHEVMSEGQLSKGDKVVFVGLGGGLTWGSSLWQL